MEFGLANEFSVELDGPTGVTIEYDNLSITLNGATPEPSSFVLLANGVAARSSSA